jgi:hypothetical protein
MVTVKIVASTVSSYVNLVAQQVTSVVVVPEVEAQKKRIALPPVPTEKIKDSSNKLITYPIFRECVFIFSGR